MTLPPCHNPTVVAHRGSSFTAPEHVRAAYEAALDEGADAFECDVRLTADDVPVCFHDATLDRVAGRRGRIGSMTFEELASIDVGVEWRRDILGAEQGSLSDVAPGSSRLLGFDEFLSIAASADRPIGLRIEVKRPSTRGDLLERRIVEALEKRGMLPGRHADWTIGAMSFSPKSLRNLHRLAPTLPLVRLYARVPEDEELAALPRWIGGVGPGIRWVREDVTLPERIHRTDRVVNVWTVDRSEDVDLMVKTGVDGIITNRPALVRDRLSTS